MLRTGVLFVILYARGLALVALNVLNILISKLSGNPVNVVLLAACTLTITAIYGWRIL